MGQALTDAGVNGATAQGHAAFRLKTDQLLLLSEHLALEDQALVRGVYKHGMSAFSLAKAMGRSPKGTQGRLRRLCQRMSSPLFRYVVRHRTNWPDHRRAIGDALILRGQTQRQTAAALGISVHRVRQELDRIRSLCDHEQEQWQRM